VRPGIFTRDNSYFSFGDTPVYPIHTNNFSTGVKLALVKADYLLPLRYVLNCVASVPLCFKCWITRKTYFEHQNSPSYATTSALHPLSVFFPS